MALTSMTAIDRGLLDNVVIEIGDVVDVDLTRPEVASLDWLVPTGSGITGYMPPRFRQPPTFDDAQHHTAPSVARLPGQGPANPNGGKWAALDTAGRLRYDNINPTE